MSKLYLECYSGISGDMTVAALLDLGADQEVLEQALKSIPVGGFDIRISRVVKAGLDVCDFDVVLDEFYENHDHDMVYLHGGEEGDGHHEHEHVHSHDHEHSHDHTHAHTHDHHHAQSHHDHVHRGMKEVADIIERTVLTPGAKRTALRIFEILGKAEAKAHGTTLEKVHFHEVGAIDSIADIIAVAVCLDNLAVEEVIIPVLYEGTGTIRCQHGILPVPVPAVANIVAANGLKLHVTGCQGELVTPTGAAIAAAIRTKEELPPAFTVLKTGLGAGKRTYECPGFVRAMLIEECTSGGNSSDSNDSAVGTSDTIYVLESNIDDCSGEALGYVMEQLLQAGARDVNYIPVYMKKNRPAYQLNVVCDAADIPVLEEIIFTETTTIGIRRVRMERTVLPRELKTIRTSLGDVAVKVCRLPGHAQNLRVYPEYESVAALCRKHKKSYQEIYQLIVRDSSEQL